LAYARAAVDACREGGEAAELPAAQLVYGLALLFKNSLKAAETELLPVLELAQRVGDQTLEVRSLTYLGLGARLQSQTERVAVYTRQASEVARASGMLEYIGAARANESWLELRAGHVQVAAERATEALRAWDKRMFPFRWMALLPLLEAEIVGGSMDRAIDCARQLLAPTQQRLPGTAATALSRALDAWAVHQVDDAQAALHSALGGLADTGYR
jgi:tetratricopeptide (TPR) repeat protein